ncbi:MAG: isoprenylcysteine carboxylmethyltransferase family protein [Patescibacteria group bacterium]|nr:isoprenylcysteine carboxylmethyltransferase family protein [Patescibacteria group bacterium]
MQYATLPAHIIDAIWIIFILVWVISMFSAKRTMRQSGVNWLTYRIITIIIIVIIIHYVGVKVLIFGYVPNLSLQWLGAVLVTIGAAVAISARFYLGRNWGMPMTVKENAELVTTGPYAYVRHPIYAGVLVSIIGSAAAFGLLWVIILVVYIGYFVPSIFVEEKIMANLFPETYPAYRARTKRLIPWVW